MIHHTSHSAPKPATWARAARRWLGGCVLGLAGVASGTAQASTVYWSVGVYSPGVHMAVGNAPAPVAVWVPHAPRVVMVPSPVVVYVPTPAPAWHGAGHRPPHHAKHEHRHRKGGKHGHRDDAYGWHRSGPEAHHGGSGGHRR